jgi:TIR domain/Domain of unknown function (DUF4062)
MQFANDIFISYAHIDDYPLMTGGKGWVSGFHGSLESFVAQYLGKEVKVWRDAKLQGNGSFGSEITEQLEQAAVLVLILSPRYVESDWCQREIQTFFEKADQASGPCPAEKRVFKVVKYPVLRDQEKPIMLKNLLGYNFYTVDPANDTPRDIRPEFGPEMEQAYFLRVSDLAVQITGQLKTLNYHNSAQVTEVYKTSEQTGTIYLAETTQDLENQRNSVKRELEQRGYLVLPDKVLPSYYPDLERVVMENLARSKLSIHMIGSRYGSIPEDAERSLIALQYELAVAHCHERSEFLRLVWMPVGLETKNARQQELIKTLREDSDWLQTGLEELKTAIQDLLTAPSSRLEQGANAAETLRVYLIFDLKDLDGIAPLYNHFLDCGWDAIFPIFEGDEADMQKEHEATLRDCDAILIYYGSSGDLWLRTKLRDLQKAADYGRTKPMLAKAIYVAAPETPLKKMLRMNDAIVIKSFTAFTPDVLAPFFKQTAQGEGGHAP